MKLVTVRSALVLSTLALTACSQDSKDSNSGSNAEYITIDVGVESGAANLTAIPAADIAFAMHLENCLSGYTSSSSDKSIRAVINDKNCKVRLDSITVGGLTYTKTADASVYRFGDSNNMLKVTGTGVLPSPIVAAHSISFSFVELAQGENSEAKISTESQSVSVSGEEAPNVEIADVHHVSFAANGAPQFSFDLRCSADITINSTSDLSKISCGNQKASDISMILIQEGSQEPTLEQLNAKTGWVSIAAAYAGYELNTSNPAKSIIKTKPFTGPGKIFGADTDANRKMLLVVKGAGASYQYFKVEIK